MTPAVLLTTAATGFGVAFVHAVIPIHWLPFVLTGRAHGWTLSRTLLVNLLAGTGHVTVTAVLGALAAWLGLTLDRMLQGIFPKVAAGVLVLFAAYYLIQQFRGHGRHHHGHADVAEDAGQHSRRGDRAAALGLISLLLVSPCEAFIPVYLAGVPSGWYGFAFLTAVLAVATLSSMLVLVTVSWKSLATARFKFIEHWESGLIGAVLLLLAVVILWLL